MTEPSAVGSPAAAVPPRGSPVEEPAAPVWEPAAPPGEPAAPAGEWSPEAARSPQASRCRLCGSVPALKATIRQHTGMIVLMRFGSLRGPFCHDCGIAKVRSMSAYTLLAGWWGMASFFVTPVVLLINLVHRIRLSDLDAPIADRAADAGLPAPLDPGRPLHRRPAILGLAVPLVAVLLIASSAVASSTVDESEVGRCVRSGTDTAQLVSCGADHDGKVVAVTDDEQGCPPEATSIIYAEDSTDRYLCVAPD